MQIAAGCRVEPVGKVACAAERLPTVIQPCATPVGGRGSIVHHAQLQFRSAGEEVAGSSGRAGVPNKVVALSRTGLGNGARAVKRERAGGAGTGRERDEVIGAEGKDAAADVVQAHLGSTRVEGELLVGDDGVHQVGGGVVIEEHGGSGRDRSTQRKDGGSCRGAAESESIDGSVLKAQGTTGGGTGKGEACGTAAANCCVAIYLQSGLIGDADRRASERAARTARQHQSAGVHRRAASVGVRSGQGPGAGARLGHTSGARTIDDGGIEFTGAGG